MKRRIVPVLLAVLAAAARGEAPKGVEHTLPATDSRYEVLVPPIPADQLHDLPMVVYLHPSKDPQLDRAKTDYWPLLREHKCLMVLPRSKGQKMWLAGEEKLVADVIADVRTRYSVDGKRVILLGVSGGGQVVLFLADRLPEKFRAVIAVSTSPVVIRGTRDNWFYPNRKVLKTCPYFVVNHISQGASLMYWRQVAAKLNPAGGSITVLPVTGKAEDYQPPAKELDAWLGQVLAGKHPEPLADPQKAAVAEMFKKPAAELPAAIEKSAPAEKTAELSKDGKVDRLILSVPAGYERAGREMDADSAEAPMTQVRAEGEKWPIVLRAEVRRTEQPMGNVLSVEEAVTRRRGMLYQVYHTGRTVAGGRTWQIKIGSITYPDAKRGWVSQLFVHAAAPVAKDPKHWLTVLATDETQEPDAAQLAELVKTALATIQIGGQIPHSLLDGRHGKR